MNEETKKLLNYKVTIAIDAAKDAENSLELLLDMLRKKQFYPRGQQYIQDVLLQMGEISRYWGELQTLENMHHLLDRKDKE